MKSTTLFGLYAVSLVALIVSLGWVTLYSLDKARWWDARIQLAQESYSLHLELEANLFRFIKQRGDALLTGNPDDGPEKPDLSARIDQNVADIRSTIAREIEMVGEEEIEELAVLAKMEVEIRKVNAALSEFTSLGQSIDTASRIERFKDLLNQNIDGVLTQMIDEALEEEVEEVEETLAKAAAVRARNETVVYVLLALATALLVVGFLSFNNQIRGPLMRLKGNLANLRKGDFRAPVALGGSREFQDLGNVLNEMQASLSEREATRKEQRFKLEELVQKRTSELQRLVDRMELGEGNRKQLMADISHELRTPLTIILGEAEVALRNSNGLSHQTSDALARIRDSAKHTSQIVDDMLTVARHEAGQLRLDRRDVDLRKVLKDAEAMFPDDISLQMPPEAARLAIDEVRLRQAMLALFQNARRYGGPNIKAALFSTATGYQISVEDDGPGLSITEKQDAFGRFFRGSNASGKGIEGSGLGLPVVKSIVEAHGGNVALEDAELGGLRVEINLPNGPAIRVVRSDPLRKSS